MAETPRTAKDIFLAALERTTPQERDAFLAQACACNDALRAEVEALLRVHDEPDSLLDRPRIDLGLARDPAATIDPLMERPGTQIGPYTLLEVIGQGGMGVVYRAQQREPIERNVALKIIKPGMDTQHVIARFDAERQALARMDHPHIAHVLDAGATDAGRPYFVMELVTGIPITDYCDQHQLSIPARLELFVSVCQAVQHAHQKGIIHRDIKPSNILVVETDDQPQPKVIDFGVAKAVGGRLTDKTAFTSLGQLVGTPLYMSPEQAGLSGQDVDTRTDVYSLGVLLYELLTGEPPLSKERFREAAYEEIRRVIRDEEPAKPSTRISSLGDAATTASGRRQVTPTHLRRALEGDLDWIVMKALEKDRTRRYETPSAYARDIQRYLRHEPVEAGPPSAIYRFRKFARRNKVTFVTTSVVAVSLVLGLVGTTWQALRARQQATRAELGERRAQEEADNARTAAAISQAVNAFLTEDLLAQADTEKEPDRDIKLLTVVERAAAQVENRFADQPLVAAAVHHTLGTVLRSLGEYQAAERHFRKAIELRQTQLGPEHQATLSSMRGLATCLLQQWRNEEAELLFRQLLNAGNRVLGPESEETLNVRNCLAVLCKREGRLDEAEKWYTENLEVNRRVRGPEHRSTLTDMINLSNLYNGRGRAAEAWPLKNAALEIAKKTLGDDHPLTLDCECGLAFQHAIWGLATEGEKRFLELLARRRRVLGPEHPNTLVSMNGLADTYQRQQRTDEAEKLYAEVLEIGRSGQCSAYPEMRSALRRLANLYSDQGRYREVASVYRQILAALDHAVAATDAPTVMQGRLALTCNELAWFLVTCPDAETRAPDEAVKLAERALALAPQYGAIWNTLGVAQYRRGNWNAALAALQKTIELQSGGKDCDFFFLAMTHWQLGNQVEARQWYDKAVTWMWKHPLGRDMQRAGGEAAALLGLSPPCLCVAMPLPDRALCTDRPLFDSESLAGLLDLRGSADAEQTRHRQLALEDRHWWLRIVDSGWQLSRLLIFPRAVSAHYSPREGCLYVGRREPGNKYLDRLALDLVNGIYRIDANGNAEEVAAATEIAGVAVDPVTGDVYFSEDNEGRIGRIAHGTGESQSWVSAWPNDNTHPVGLAVPDTVAGGETGTARRAFVVNHGGEFRSDEVYSFAIDQPAQQTLLHQDAPDEGPLSVPLDVAMAGGEVYLADRQQGILRLRDDGTCEPVATAEWLQPTGIAADPTTGHLYVVDSFKQRLVCVDRTTGNVNTIAEGLTCEYWGGAGIDVTPDGQHIICTDHDTGRIMMLTRKSQETSAFERGRVRAAVQEWEAAIRDFSEALALEPEHAVALCERGFCYARLGQLDQAQSDWAAAVAIEPQVGAHYHFRGEMLSLEARFQEAVEEYDKAIQLTPQLGRAFAGRAAIWLEQQEMERALNDANRAVELDPTRALSYAERGFVFETREETEQAESDWAKAVQLGADCAGHYRNRAELLARNAHWQDAARALDKAIRFEPDNYQLYEKRAEVRAACQQWSGAEQDLLKLIQLGPANPGVWQVLGLVRLAAGDEEAYRRGARSCSSGMRMPTHR